MSLWIVFALMTGAALLTLLWPLRRGWATAAAQTPDDSAVYRDQLQEIERDLAAGSIGANEAEAARIEVSRRLLAADEAKAARMRDAETNRETAVKTLLRGRQLSAALAVIVLTFGAGGLYLTLGSPDLPGQPLAARIAARTARVIRSRRCSGGSRRTSSNIRRTAADGRSAGPSKATGAGLYGCSEPHRGGDERQPPS
jgi:cytochrome c-type biogenesis protein CcmH